MAKLSSKRDCTEKALPLAARITGRVVVKLNVLFSAESGVVMLDRHFFLCKVSRRKTVIGQTPVVMKNGAMALQGKCPSCDNVTYKIVNREAIVARTQMAQIAKRQDRLVMASVVAFVLGLSFGLLLSLI